MVLTCFGIAYLLIPKETELVERLVEDGRHDRARELVIGARPAGDFPAAEETGATDESDADLAAVDEGTPALDIIEVLLENGNGLASIDEEAAHRISTLVKICSDSKSALKLLDEHSARLTEAGRIECYEALAQRSVQLSQPGIAADLYFRLWDMQAPDTERLAATVTTCRYAGRPKQALEAIDRYLRENDTPFGRLPKELRMTTVSLRREINDGSGAFDLLSEEYIGAQDAVTRQHIMDLMTVTAVQSDRIKDCLPIVEDYVASLDTAKSTWQELLKANADRQDDDDFLKYAMILGQHREWGGNIDAAFDTFRQLAALGHREALDRCVTIYPWIDRQAEATELLAALVPIPDRPQYTLLSARLEADRGHLSRAIELMEGLLEKGEPDHWLEYAQMLDESGQFKEAIAAYQHAVELTPEDRTPLKFASRLMLSVGQRDDALAALKQLDASEHDDHSLENYLMLAGASGDVEAEERALGMRIEKHVASPRAPFYCDLSEHWRQRGDHEKAITIVRNALKLLPDSQTLQLNLADLLIQSRQFEEAREVLSRHSGSGDVHFIGRLLGIASEVSDPLAVLTALNTDARTAAWPPSLRLQLASLYELSQQIDTAMKIYQSTTGGEAQVSRISAEIAFQRGQISTALRHQRDYLNRATEPDYEGWMFLGDILQASGRREEARGAYQQALHILKGDITPRTVNSDGTVAVAPQSKSG